ncbi:hypothetical protein J2S66_001856 [Saccharothrix longispora]|uniref:Uncharacterized protein n=1 Tax=Saccharothrix longispora TaxID=33920 RepID=A0ABU1PS47_9PSEU|nr:hypothetical protein [Saccharothrix longispora]
MHSSNVGVAALAGPAAPCVEDRERQGGGE